MTRNYNLLLLILRKWSVDNTKGTRCFGLHIRELARKAFPSGNLYPGSEAENNKKLQSLLRLAENRHGNEWPYRKKTGATGFTLEEIHVRLSDSYVSKHFIRPCSK